MTPAGCCDQTAIHGHITLGGSTLDNSMDTALSCPVLATPCGGSTTMPGGRCVPISKSSEVPTERLSLFHWPNFLFTIKAPHLLFVERLNFSTTYNTPQK